jgi:tripeptide aminopeptidase
LFQLIIYVKQLVQIMPKRVDAKVLQRLFLRLLPIEGVALGERLIADEIIGLLRQNGIQVQEDDAGKRLQGNTGNLICLPPDFNPHDPALLLNAHLDTVQSTARLEPVAEGDAVRTNGTTILGADNRLGVAILLHLLLTLARQGRAHKNFMVVFTVAEEIGMLGATQLDLSRLNLKQAFVFDCSRRPGTYIRECVGSTIFQLTFIGKAAHSGVAPEEGVNAIALASTALAQIKTGRIDTETTANLGKIYGGTAINIVPDKVVVEGEVRSFSRRRIQEQIDMIRDTAARAVNGVGAFHFDSYNDFEPYAHAPDAPVVRTLERALRAVALVPNPIRYMGGSDANIWNARGIPAVNIGIGAQNPHTFEEFVLIEDLIKAAEIAFALVEPDEQGVR